MSSFLGKAGVASLEKAVDVLDVLGSSMTQLIGSHMARRDKNWSAPKRDVFVKISIRAFEVANTIAKGAILLQSLSKESIQFLEREILHSKGVQELVSTETNELLTIAANDKWEEFHAFRQEVVMFGDLCTDPQLHNLDRFLFSRLGLEPSKEKQIREDPEITMQELNNLAHHTSELYDELYTTDILFQQYRRKLEEVDSLRLPRTGESITILHSELKDGRKIVRQLKKKSLWSNNLEEVVKKLCDIVTFIHQEILEAFGVKVKVFESSGDDKREQLGVAGLALHYAKIITQIDNIASRPTSLSHNMRYKLFGDLPNSVKTGLRFRLQTLDSKEVLTVPQIKAEMEKTLRWLVPMATNTTKAHLVFGWVGEWANTSNEFGNTATQNNVVRLQTLYHADKQKTDEHILELITWLHRLVTLVLYGENGSSASSPVGSPTYNELS